MSTDRRKTDHRGNLGRQIQWLCHNFDRELAYGSFLRMRSTNLSKTLRRATLELQCTDIATFLADIYYVIDVMIDNIRCIEFNAIWLWRRAY